METRFACLAINALTDHRVDSLTGRADLGSGYRLALPDGAIDLNSWKSYVGEHEIDSMHKANAWVWVEGESSADLRTKIGHFETGLLLTRAPQIRDAWIIEGPVENGVPRVSSFGRRIEHFIKEPPYPLTTRTLACAAAMADVLGRVFATNALRGRLERGFISLVLAMNMQHIEDSILYLMRALEGMLSADDNKQFKARAAALLRGGSPELIHELYHVRNKLTHVEPIDEVFPGRTRLEAAQRGRQLQAFLYHFATGAYRTVLSRPELMERITQADVGAYWGEVVLQKKPPPLVVTVADNLWNFDHDDRIHYQRQPDVVIELEKASGHDKSSSPTNGL